MKKIDLGSAAAMAAWVSSAGAHSGHDGIPASEPGLGYSLLHHLSSGEHLAAFVAIGALVALAVGAVLRYRRRQN
ncbi:MAG TPA: hypothetical protein VJS66_06750 [Burkholderiales bacterium]|nr:hypothetical protein [Burkholderiales bacterium]